MASSASSDFFSTQVYNGATNTYESIVYATDGTSAGSHTILDVTSASGGRVQLPEFVSYANASAIAFELVTTTVANGVTNNSVTVYESNGTGLATRVAQIPNASSSLFPKPLVTTGVVANAHVGTAQLVKGFGVLDDDTAAGAITATVTAIGGDITASSSGATVFGAGSSSMTITGSVADVNAALANLYFFGTTAGKASISISATDSGVSSSTLTSPFTVASAALAPFQLWASIANLFVSNGPSIDSVNWGRGNLVGGGYPIWVNNSVPVSASAMTGYSYTIAISSQDWVQTVQSEAVVATVNFPNPFPVSTLAGDMIFSSTATTGVGALVYWAPNPTPNGGFDLEFQGLNATYPTAPSAGPSTTVSGDPTAIISGVHGLRGWTLNYSGSDFVYSYVTAGDYTNSENIYFQAFKSDGTAEGQAVEVAANFSTASNFYVGYSSGSGYAFSYGQLAGANSGWYSESFDPTTGALGAVTKILALPNFTTIYGMGWRTLSDGSATRFVEGVVNNTHVLQVFKSTADGTSTLQQTITLTGAGSDRWSYCGVSDPLNNLNDFTALVLNDNNQVSLRLFHANGAQIGGPVVIPNLTSFDRVCQLGSDRTRIEISYTYTNASGGQSIGAYVYDTQATPYNYTLGASNGETIGTVFADTFTDNTGIHYVDGGGGADTFIVPSSLATGSGVDLTTNASGQIVVNAGSGNATTLARFTTIDIGAQTLSLGGAAAAPTLTLASAGKLVLGDPIASNYTIAIPAASAIEVQVGDSLGAQLAKWQSGDSVLFDSLADAAGDHLKFVAGPGGVGGVLELLGGNNSVIDTLFHVSSGSPTTANFSLAASGNGRGSWIGFQ